MVPTGVSLQRYSEQRAGCRGSRKVQSAFPAYGDAYRLRAVCYRAVGIEQKAVESDAIADKRGAPKVIDDNSRVVIPE